MSERYIYSPIPYVKIHMTRFTKSEHTRAWWDKCGQGNEEARARGANCVVIPCTYQEALVFSALALRHFAIPTCTNFNGSTFSFYVGDTGNVSQTREAFLKSVFRYFAGEDMGKLFADEEAIPAT